MSCRNCSNNNNNNNNNEERDLVRSLSRFIGEVVTIYTQSGGDSGRGFTGVLVAITSDPVVRLVSDFGPAPGCALGSCCDKKRKKCKCHDSNFDDNEFDEEMDDAFNRFDCRRIRNAGAIVDIPVSKIVAFVHNGL